MEQDSTAETSGDGGFTPAPLADILRSDVAPEPREPAGRQATEAPSAAPAETGETPADQPRDDRPRDEHGRFAPKAGEQQGETGPPPAEQTAPQHVPVAAVLEERRKRQALEAEIKELRARVAAPPAPASQPTAPAQPETPLEDLMFQAPDQFVERVQAPLRKQVADMQLMVGEMIARQQPDYDQAEAAVFEWLEQDPATKQRVAEFVTANPMQAPQWVLQEGRKLLHQRQWGPVIQQYGSPEAFIAAQRQQPAPAASQPSSAPPAPPGSLASVRSAGARSAPSWSGPTPLSEILGRRP